MSLRTGRLAAASAAPDRIVGVAHRAPDAGLDLALGQIVSDVSSIRQRPSERDELS